MRILGQIRSIFLVDDEIIQPLAFATILAPRRRRVSTPLHPATLARIAPSHPAADQQRQTLLNAAPPSP